MNFLLIQDHNLVGDLFHGALIHAFRDELGLREITIYTPREILRNEFRKCDENQDVIIVIQEAGWIKPDAECLYKKLKELFPGQNIIWVTENITSCNYVNSWPGILRICNAPPSGTSGTYHSKTTHGDTFTILIEVISQYTKVFA